ncbi:MAG: helix-turn-helix domain-containing protein [bacterium]
MNEKVKHHYTECGLPDVWIECRRVKDDTGADIFIIPAINRLHKLIAEGIVMSDSALTGPEIRFLRSEMGLTQAELGELLHRTRLTIARWESEDVKVGGAMDTLIRMFAIGNLKLKKAGPDEISRKYKIARGEKKYRIPAYKTTSRVKQHRIAA